MSETNIERALGRVEGKLDGILAELRSQRDEQRKLDERVDALEKDQHTGKFVLSMLAAFVGFLASNVQSIISWIRS